VLVAGRSTSCHLVLDDALVSRRHAQFVVSGDAVSVHDFNSVNGVFVNSKRVTGTERLKEGDEVQLGTQIFLLKSAPQIFGGEIRDRITAETLHGVSAGRELSGRPQVPMLMESESTFSGQSLDLLGGVAEKVLALGRGEEAEKVLQTTLQNILTDVRAGRAGTTSSQTFDKASEYAVKLAEATGKGRWFDYAIELHAELKRPLPVALVDELYKVLRRVDSVNLTALRGYVAILRGLQSGFGPSERFVLQRLDGLERLAALR
jgi:pSer/pThr/pTyr-binding forkhead associated (FHA) protein